MKLNLKSAYLFIQIQILLDVWKIYKNEMILKKSTKVEPFESIEWSEKIRILYRFLIDE